MNPHSLGTVLWLPRSGNFPAFPAEISRIYSLRKLRMVRPESGVLSSKAELQIKMNSPFTGDILFFKIKKKVYCPSGPGAVKAYRRIEDKGIGYTCIFVYCTYISVQVVIF